MAAAGRAGVAQAEPAKLSTPRSLFRLVKHSFWRGSYTRILGVRSETFFTADPSSNLITNEWPLDALLHVEETNGPILWLFMRRRLPCDVAVAERLCFALDDPAERLLLVQLLRSRLRRAPAAPPHPRAPTLADDPVLVVAPLAAPPAVNLDLDGFDNFSVASESPLLVRKMDVADELSDLEDFTILSKDEYEIVNIVEAPPAKGDTATTPATHERRDKAVRDAKKQVEDENKNNNNNHCAEAVLNTAANESWQRMWPLTA
jgi:hypothetical protein